VEACNNLGIVLAARGDHATAARQFEAALARKPDFIDAYNNLARAFLSVGQPDGALAALRRALAIAETADTKSLFVQCVKALGVAADTDDFRPLLICALSEPWGRPGDLAAVAARLVKQDSEIRSCTARIMTAWPRRLAGDELLDPWALAAICGHPLLRCLMQATAIADIELERLLTGIRFALLQSASAEDGPSAQAALATPDSIRGSGQRGDSMTARAGHSPAGGSSAREEAGEGSEILEFCCALARQCFLNEQVFALTDEELSEAQ